MDTSIMPSHRQHLSGFSPPTILVVEDDPLVRMPIVEYLRDCGYTVLEADNAAQAVSLIDASDEVDLVFSDIRMPGAMDGLGLARWVRQTHPDLPVLLTSGYAGGRTLERDLGLGRLIEKPYSQAQVARRIQAALGR
jgi:CheY-like chemotaxis protein